MDTPVINPMNVYKKLQPDAINEVVVAVKEIVARHHGYDSSLHTEADYCAVALFCLVDEHAKRFNKTPAQRRGAFGDALRQVKRIRDQMETEGVAGLKI